MDNNYNINFEIDSKYTVTGVEGGKGFKNRVYSVECSVCNEDKELFPTPFKSPRPALKVGKIPCGCSTNYAYTSEQLKVLLKRKEDELGTKIEILSSTVDKCSDVAFYCCERSEGKITSVKKFLGKTRVYCPHKDEHWRTEQTKLRLEGLYKGIYTDFHFNKETSLWDFKCNSCSNDEFVREGLCTGVFSASASRLGKTDVSTCRCGTYSILTPDQNLYRCVRTAEEGYEITGYEEPYKGVYTLTGFVCPKGNKNLATVVSFLSGRRCTCCTDNGFNRTKKGLLYIVKWEHISGITFLKYGITNREVEERIKEQFREASEGFSYEILRIVEGEGEYVSQLERSIKEKVGGRYASPYIFPDGWTETCSISKEDEIKSLINNV